MSVGVRCFQCKVDLKGLGTGTQHAALTGHTWQPGYYCTTCEASFSKHIECEQHIQQVGAYCKRAATVPSTPSTHMHRSSSSSAVNRHPLMPNGRVQPVYGVAAAAPTSLAASLHTMSPTANNYGSSPLWQCTMCQPPVIFLSQEALRIHSMGKSTCAKCLVHFPNRANLQDHYRTSKSRVHPKCRDCGTGFLGDGEREAHRTRCPRVVAAVVESMRSEGASGPGPDGVSIAAASTSACGPGRDALKKDTVTSQQSMAASLRPSGSDSDVSSLALSPAVTVSHHDNKINVQGGTCTSEPPVTVARNQDSDVGAPQVNVAHSKVLDKQEEDKPLPSDDSEAPNTPTTITAVLDLEDEDAESLDADSLSFHCRVCLADPCIRPVATLCGHIFCHSCIVREFATTMCCPVCGAPSLIRLHAGRRNMRVRYYNNTNTNTQDGQSK